MLNNTLTALLSLACVFLGVALFREGRPAPPVLPPTQTVAVGMYAPVLVAEGTTDVLDRRIPDFSIDTATLDDALTAAARAGGADLWADWQALSKALIDPKSPVRPGRLTNATVGDALRWVVNRSTVDPSAIGFRLRNGEVFVSTPGELAKLQVTVVYNARDLIDVSYEIRNRDPGVTFSRDEAVQLLNSVVMETVAPQSWIGRANYNFSIPTGEGSIKEFAGLLVITQAPENHKDIAALLASLRQSSHDKDPDGRLVKLFGKRKSLLDLFWN